MLILWIVRPIRIQPPPVITLLNFERDFMAVWISPVQQKLARSPPPRIKVGKIPSRNLPDLRIGDLMRAQNPYHIKPHTRRRQRGDKKKHSVFPTTLHVSHVTTGGQYRSVLLMDW